MYKLISSPMSFVPKAQKTMKGKVIKICWWSIECVKEVQVNNTNNIRAVVNLKLSRALRV